MKRKQCWCFCLALLVVTSLMLSACGAPSAKNEQDILNDISFHDSFFRTTA